MPAYGYKKKLPHRCNKRKLIVVNFDFFSCLVVNNKIKTIFVSSEEFLSTKSNIKVV